MIIKKSTLDTTLIMLVMLVTILPTFLARPLVALSIAFIVVRIIFSNDLFLYLNKKIIIFVLFIPGIIGAILAAPEHLIRFSGIFLILFGFPFSSFKIKNMPIVILSSLILLYLIITQILLLHGNTTLLNFRDFGYRHEWSYVWEYGHTKEILKNAFVDKDSIRAGGLYFNPNVLSGSVLLYYFIFDYSWKTLRIGSNLNKINWKTFFYWSMFFLVLVCLLLTKTRTIVIAFMAYLVFQNLNLNDLLRLKLNKKLISYLILVFIILFIGFYERIKSGLVENTGSMHIKFKILYKYLDRTNLNQWVTGGNYNIFFDSEWGNWIGATGFMGIIAFFSFYLMVFRFEPKTKAMILSLLLISFGNTLFYNLFFVSILVPLFIILLSYSKQGLMIK